jgi:hypothetical protein
MAVTMRHRPVSPERSGIDTPPPVVQLPMRAAAAAGATLQSVTPELITTLQADEPFSCAQPVILNQTYIVVATVGGMLCFFDLRDAIGGLVHKVILPDAATSMIVELVVVVPSTGTSGSNTDNTQIIAVSDMGDIHKVEPGRVLSSFTTNSCGVTCACCIVQRNVQVLILGYQTGTLEAWNLDTEQLIVRGIFDGGDPIRAVAPLESKRNKYRDRDETIANDNEDDKQSHREYIIVTLESEQRRPPASMMEVLELTSMERAWNELVATGVTDVAAVVRLEQQCILPEPGMEIIDAQVLLGRNSCPYIPSCNANCLLPLPTTSNSIASCAAGLADGTACVLSAVSLERGEFSWGVFREQDQMLLSYPCVGMGSVKIVGDHDWSGAYVAFALRGATTYLYPLLSELTHLKVVCCPHDVDSDGLVQHVHGFTTGNVVLSDTGLASVLVYAWSGGLIDVYSCQLRRKEVIRRSIMTKLMDNGSVAMLQALLSSCERSESSLAGVQSLWSLASKEIAKHEGNDSLTLENLCSDNYKAFRMLLLTLAEPTSYAS